MIHVAIIYILLCIVGTAYFIYAVRHAPYEHEVHEVRWVSADEITRDVREQGVVYIDTRKHRLN